MKMSENPSEIAAALASSQQPWLILERIKQDPNLFESHEIQSATIDIFRRDTDLTWPVLEVVCAIPAMVTNHRIHKAVKELGGLAIVFFVEEVMKNAPKESLEVLAVDKSFAEMIESCYDTVLVLWLILQVPELKASKTIRNAALKNKKGLYQGIDEAVRSGDLSDAFETMQQYPEILVSDDFIDIIVEVIRHPDVHPDISLEVLDVPQLRENARIWDAVLDALTEREIFFWWMSDYFGVDWHLLARKRRAPSIEAIRESVDRLIQERGWRFTRAALIREHASCEYLFSWGDYTLEEMEEASLTFFEVFDLREFHESHISMEEILLGIENADSLEIAGKKAKERASQLLTSKRESKD